MFIVSLIFLELKRSMSHENMGFRPKYGWSPIWRHHHFVRIVSNFLSMRSLLWTLGFVPLSYSFLKEPRNFTKWIVQMIWNSGFGTIAHLNMECIFHQSRFFYFKTSWGPPKKYFVMGAPDLFWTTQLASTHADQRRTIASKRRLTILVQLDYYKDNTSLASISAPPLHNGPAVN